MKSKLLKFGLIFLSVCCAAVYAVTPSSKIKRNLLAGYDSITPTKLKTDVSYLASDSLQGRLSLSPGDQQAMDWIVAQFKAAGLKPAVGDSYLQPVEVIEYVPNKKKSYVQLERDNLNKKWLKPDVMTEFHKDINVKGEVVFAGYGITAPELHYDDYAGIDVRGKIVMVFEHEPQEDNEDSIFNGKANTIHAINRIKALNAQKHGAIAILIAPEPNRKHPSNLERYKRIGGSAARKVPLPSQVLVDDALQIPIAVIPDSVANKIVGDSVSLKEVQTAIDNYFQPQSQVIRDAKITLHDENTSRRTALTYNVAGLLEGSDPTLKAETIIISAHHDHDGMSGNSKVWHGADDNASGTAGVVNLAQAFAANVQAKNGLRPKRSILFVVFGSEERGLLGAYYMAAHPLRPLATTRAMMNFDMIGRNEALSKQTNGIINIPADTSNRLNLIGSHYSPDYQAIIEHQNEYVGLTLDNRFDEDPVLNTFFRSDQFPFVLNNVPAFWWFTGFHPDYHHTTDTADKINYDKMAKILQLAYLSGMSFANDDTSPKFVKNP